MRKQVRDVSAEAMKKLSAYDWPGNIRELRNIMERAVMLTTGMIITSEAVQLPDEPSAASGDLSEMTFRDAQAQFEAAYFRALLAKAGGNKQKASALAEVDRTTLYDHLRKLGLGRIMGG